MTKLRTTTWILGAVLFCGAALGAQDGAPDAARLDALLTELAKVSPEVWKARLAAMQQEIAAKEKRAAALRQEAKKLEEQAASEAAAAAALKAEMQKVTELRGLLEKMQFRAPAAAKPKPDSGEKAEEKPKADAKPKPEEKAKEKEKEKAKAEPAPESAAGPKPEPAPPAASAMAQKTAMAAATESDETLLTWDDHLFDVFDENCTVCHEPGDKSGGLDLSTFTAAMQGGGSGTTIVAGDPQASRLWMLVSHQEKPTMPPDEPRLDQDYLTQIRTWIAQGAPKDMAQAKKLAAERAAQRAKAAAEAAAGEAEGETVTVVMPAFESAEPKAVALQSPALRAVAASPVAPLLAVPGLGQVLLVHAADTRELGVLPFAFGRPRVLEFSADGSRLLAAGGIPGKTGGAVVYDVATGAEVGRFGERRDEVLAAAISGDGRTVAVGGTRRRTAVHAVGDGAELYVLEHDDWVTALDFASDGDRLASADRAGVIRVVEASTGRGRHELRGHEGEITALAWRDDGSLLASGGVDRSVRLWRDSDGRELWRRVEHGDDVLALAWRGRDRIVSGGADRRLRFWKTDGNRDGDLPDLPDWVYGVAVTGDGARAMTADWGGGLGVVDLESRELVARLEPFVARP